MPELITLAEAAKMLRLSDPTIRRMIRQGAMPTPLQVGGRKLFFRRDELENYLESCRVDPTKQ